MNSDQDNHEEVPLPINESSSETTEEQQIQPPPATAENGLAEALANFSDQLREVNRISEHRERIIDQLHQENQRLKQGELQQLLMPVFRDLIRLYDDLKITTASYESDGNEKFTRELVCYRETVSDILYRHGVELIEVASGENFNPKEHKAVATVAADLERDRTIAKVIRDGFKTDLKIIRNVEVEVYRHIPQTATEESQSAVAENENQEAR
jgi:molecular chaperone GrpE (heat shock protein)